jgi:hypothetical protein
MTKNVTLDGLLSADCLFVPWSLLSSGELSQLLPGETLRPTKTHHPEFTRHSETES